MAEQENRRANTSTGVRGARGGTSSWSPSQVAVLVVSLARLAWSVAGLIANPDFATGDAATAKQVLGVDFNGWHALSGILLALPGLLGARRADLVGAVRHVGCDRPGGDRRLGARRDPPDSVDRLAEQPGRRGSPLHLRSPLR